MWGYFRPAYIHRSNSSIPMTSGRYKWRVVLKSKASQSGLPHSIGAIWWRVEFASSSHEGLTWSFSKKERGVHPRPRSWQVHMKVSRRNEYATSRQIQGHAHWCIQFSLLWGYTGIWIFQEVHDPDLWLLLRLEWSHSAPPPVSGQDSDPFQKWPNLVPNLLLQLKGVVSDWFYSFPSCSIHSFGDLTKLFIAQYSSWQDIKQNNCHLLSIKIRPSDNLKAYISYFQNQLAKAHNCSEDAYALTFVSGL